MAHAMVPVKRPAAGVLLVRYETAGDLEPEAQKDLVDAVRQLGMSQPVGIVFVVGQNVRTVQADVPKYWLGITGEKHNGLSAMAIVSSSVAVHAAALGFSVANRLRGLDIEVKTFDDEAKAVAWVAEVVGRVRAQAAASA